MNEGWKRLEEWSERHGLVLSGDQLSRFSTFEEHLYEANQVANLTRVPKEECWVRHFVDSLLFEDCFPLNSSVLDLGTGPGFPAWPLACGRPDLKVTALDSNGKMLAFLRSQPLPNLEVVEARAEDWGERNQFQCVTGRAIAPLPIQLEISVGPCQLEGWVMPLRTPSDELEEPDLQTLGLQLVEIVSRHLPDTETERVLPIYQKVRPTPGRFPRRWAEIKARPLVLR